MTPEKIAALDPDAKKVLDTILLQQPWREHTPLTDAKFLDSCYQLLDLDLIQIIEVGDTFEVVPNLNRMLPEEDTADA